jgi:hypothetical protein
VRAITEPLGGDERHQLVDALRRLCETPLDHPSIARPLDCGLEGEVPYLVHAQLPGQTVDEYLTSAGPRPLAEVALRVTHLAAAIDYAAAAGIHHGAMGPGDVVFGPDSSGIAGFGVAQALREANGVANEPTAADDIYALAAMTYELLSGQAYTGEDVAQAVARLPAAVRADRRALTAALESALSADPSRWPATALQFAGALHDAQIVEPVMGRLAFDDEETPAGGAEPTLVAPRARPAPARFMDVADAPDAADTTGHAAGRLLFDAPLHASELAGPPTVVVHAGPERTPVALDHVSEAEAVDGSDALLGASAPFAPPPRVPSSPRVAAAVAVIALLIAGGAGVAWVVMSRPDEPPVAAAADVRSPEPARIQVDDDAIGGNRGPAAAPAPDAGVATPPASPPSSSAPPARPDVARAAAVPAARGPEAGAGRDGLSVSGRVLVRSNPPGAQVLVNGEPHGSTPVAIRGLALGTHTIAVSAPGYPAWQQRVTLTAAEPSRSFDLSLGDSAAAAPAPAADGALMIDSRPAGAQVWMDGALVGTTPLLVSGVGAGAHAVRIELQGYRSWSTSVQVNRGERTRVAASLER